MQLTGNQFSDNTAIFGNDLSTFPDFPAEIRAPAGSLFGVSSFQLQFGSREIYTPGDDVDVLVAMNPAALKVDLENLKEHGILILNTDNFTPKNLKLAKYDEKELKSSSAWIDIADREFKKHVLAYKKPKSSGSKEQKEPSDVAKSILAEGR